MSNDIQEVGFTMPSGKVVFVPSADTVQWHHCGEPDCEAMHLFLIDQAGQPIAECTLSIETLVRMTRLLVTRGLT